LYEVTILLQRHTIWIYKFMLKSQEFIYCKVKPLQEPVSIIFLFFLRDNKLRSFFLCYQTDLYGRGM